ncbi:hypothetical protein Tco_0042935, partial [Tanacetum coccineum]
NALLWSLDERVPRMDDGSQLLKALNVLMLKILTLAAARMLTPTGPTGQTHWGDSMANNPMPAAHSTDAQLKVGSFFLCAT